MLIQTDLTKTSPRFGAAAAGTTFLCVLIGHLLDDLLLASLLKLPWVEAAFSISNKSVDELAAFKRAVTGVAGPFLMFGITIGALKVCLPRQPLASLLGTYGLTRATSARILLAAFIAGLGVMAVFDLLNQLYPPPEFSAEHPANIINAGSNVDKLLFVVSVVVLAPIAEEFLFRGVLYGAFSRAWNRPVAGVVVTVIFILVHPEAISSGYWLTHAFLYLTAVLLMLIRVGSGTVNAGIMFHAGVNAGIVF